MGARITIVIPYNPLDELSGLQNLARRWARGLVPMGHRVEIFTLGRSGTDGDVVVVGFRSMAALCASLARRREPSVVHWMEVWPNRPHVVLQHLTARLGRRRGHTEVLTTETPGNLERRGARRGLGRLLRSAYDGFVVSSPDFLAEYAACGIDAAQVLVVRHGLLADEPFAPVTADERRAVRSRLGLDPDRAVVVYLGRMVERKRPLDLVGAAVALVEAGSDAQFVLVGESWHHEDSIDAQVREVVERVGSAQVMVHRHSERPWEYFQAADVAVLPSERDGEAFVVLEALACGAVVLVADVPVLHSFGAPAGALHTFPLGDLRALQTAIADALGPGEGPGDDGPDFVATHRSLAALLVPFVDRFVTTSG